MSQKIIAIGDIHGCANALAALLEEIQPTASDIVVPLGDYIDRGPDSAGVIDLLIEWRDRCHLMPLMGNHEIMLLTAIEHPSEESFWRECGGDATVSSYGKRIEDIPEPHLTFLRSCRPHAETPNHFFIHANYDDRLSLAEQPDYLRYWEHLSYHIPARHVSGKTAVVGHTPQPDGEVLDLDHLICIDTFCVGGRWLTALDVNSGDIWQADKVGNLRSK
ncbi:MAG: serine/threonine protein phosphatase [Planctomycetales bacterium]|nr:serine/threonine protein phosphatase [Planctomycetales bacterium]